MIDDCQAVFAGNPRATQLAERIVTTGGPAGVGLIVTARGAGLAYFGGSRILRAGLGATNRAVFGTGTEAVETPWRPSKPPPTTNEGLPPGRASHRSGHVLATAALSEPHPAGAEFSRAMQLVLSNDVASWPCSIPSTRWADPASKCATNGRLGRPPVQAGGLCC